MLYNDIDVFHVKTLKNKNLHNRYEGCSKNITCSKKTTVQPSISLVFAQPVFLDFLVEVRPGNL